MAWEKIEKNGKNFWIKIRKKYNKNYFVLSGKTTESGDIMFVMSTLGKTFENKAGARAFLVEKI